jgi:hypothetical protein
MIGVYRLSAKTEEKLPAVPLHSLQPVLAMVGVAISFVVLGVLALVKPVELARTLTGDIDIEASTHARIVYMDQRPGGSVYWEPLQKTGHFEYRAPDGGNWCWHEGTGLEVCTALGVDGISKWAKPGDIK